MPFVGFLHAMAVGVIRRGPLLAVTLTGLAFIGPRAEAQTFISGNSSVTIDPLTGGISDWTVDAKALVQGNHVSPLSFSYQRPEDAVSRSAPRSAAFKVREVIPEANGKTIRVEGEMADGVAVLADASIHYELGDPGKVLVSVKFSPRALLAELRQATWNLPLNLNHRKRIAYDGDYGMKWDTRYFYQFLTDSPGRLLEDPERNEWQHFSLDFLSPESFRLWRAESNSTSPLVMQSGEKAAGFVQVYDEEKGVALLAPDAANAAPKSLRVYAPGGGEIKLEFWPSTASPLLLDSALAKETLFGREHRFELVGSPSAEASAMLRETVSKEAESSSSPDPQHALDEPEWLLKTPEGDPGFVAGGYPFAQGALTKDDPVEVVVGATAVPAQTQPLAFWPDGSVKWMLLNFPLASLLKNASLEDGPPDQSALTFRTGRWLPVEVRRVEKPKPASAKIIIKNASDSYTVDTGALRFSVQKGAVCLRDFHVGQRTAQGRNETPFLSATWIHKPTQIAPAESLVVGGEEQSDSFVAESITVEEDGPYRGVVKLEGMVGTEMRATLRIEVFADSAKLKVTQTSEFLFADPRETFLKSLVLRLPTGLGNSTLVQAGGEAGSFPFPQASSYRLTQLTPDFFKATAKPEAPPVRTGNRSEGWLQVGSAEGGGFVGIRNFWQMAPKEVSYDAKNGLLEAWLWPADGPPMDVRRYSDYPHRGQGETTTGKNDWVQTFYYKNEPFVGVSRTNEVLFDFEGSDRPSSMMADFQSRPLLYAGWKRYAAAGVTLPGPGRDAAPRLWQNLDALTEFWLYHQKLHGWYGAWTFGNMVNSFKSGYGWLLQPDELRRLIKETPSNPNLRAERKKRKLDYVPQNDWAFDNGRSGWQNTEGLPNLFFQNQYLRSGNRALYFVSEALARYSRDVVIRHSGQWLGRGTRHGVQAWSCGNHEERQSTPTEFKLNYFLSGDGRTRDSLDHLYTSYYSQTSVTVDAAHSARLGALMMHSEMTNDPAEKEVLRKYVATFCSPEGLYVSPQISFPNAEKIAPPQDLNSGSMFFHTFGGMHALIEYYQITKDEALRGSIIKMADAALADPAVVERFMRGRLTSAQMFWPSIGFAAVHADNPEKYRAFIKDYVSKAAWKLAYSTVTQNPEHWSGPTAGLETNVSGSWFWTNWAYYFLQSQPEKDLLSPAVEEGLLARERDGFKVSNVTESWQSELDAFDDLQFYLAKDRPWDPAPVSPAKQSVKMPTGVVEP